MSKERARGWNMFVCTLSGHFPVVFFFKKKNMDRHFFCTPSLLHLKHVYSLVQTVKNCASPPKSQRMLGCVVPGFARHVPPKLLMEHSRMPPSLSSAQLGRILLVSFLSRVQACCSPWPIKVWRLIKQGGAFSPVAPESWNALSSLAQALPISWGLAFICFR